MHLNKICGRINKLVEYCVVKVKQYIKEKKFKGNSDYPIKYMLYENTSPILIVIFSSCTRKGVKARYNYVKSLNQYNVNKLFILDNYGEDGRGCYYLGENRDFRIRDNTKELIDSVKKKLGIVTTVFCGSSKGGWAALYFGLDYVDSHILIGAPQYKLGNYFLAVPDTRMENYVFGKYRDEDIEWLNCLLEKKIEVSNKSNIYLHYSKFDHTYEEHIKYLIQDIKKNSQIHLTEDVSSYKNHGDVSLFFPIYLKKIVEMLIDNYH